MSLPWTRYMPEVAMALSLLATLLGLSVAAYREHKRSQAHKLDRFMRIGKNYIMREMK